MLITELKKKVGNIEDIDFSEIVKYLEEQREIKRNKGVLEKKE